MTPTLGGRLQTRLFLLLVVGTVWTLVIGPFLPNPAGLSLGDLYSNALQVILWTAGVGLLWEFVYHGLQQFRWEKDWPILFALLNGFNEGLVVWLLVGPAGLVTAGGIPGSTFLVHFATTWIVTWLWVVGPHRMVFIRWRFEGGRLL